MRWPEWWVWELAFIPHVEHRTEERAFTELELRHMLDTAVSLRPSRALGRFVVTTRRRGQSWCVVLEPDFDERLLYVVTAYPVENRS